MNQRLHFFDNGKAFASVLGFFYHVSLIFSVSWNINVHEDEFSSIFFYFKELLSLFRMPLFVFISGYFTIYAINKYNFSDFLKNRLIRLGIPLISTLFTFVFMQRIYSDVLFKGNSTVTDVIVGLIPWSDSFKLSHLWFLYLIIVYSVILYLISIFIKKYKNRFHVIINKIKKSKPYTIDGCFVLFSFISILFFTAIGKLSPINHGLLPFVNFGRYLPYFIMGAFTYLHWNKYSKFFLDLRKNKFRLSLFIMIISFTLSFLFANSDSLGFNIAHLFLQSIAKYYSLLLALHILYTFFNKTNTLYRYLSDSSYSIYLLHQPIIIVVSYYYLKYINTSNYISFFVILLSSIFISYLLDYFIIRNTRMGKFLFTGVKLKHVGSSTDKEKHQVS